MYQRVFKPFLFNFDPEIVHDRLMQSAALFDLTFARNLVSSIFSYEHPSLKCQLAGLEFDNPVGLAAGFDKHCRAVGLLSGLGFGALELGSVTALAQPGNPKPRIFRFSADKALINRMGFPSEGADIVAHRLKHVRKIFPDVKLGINIGKSKAVANEEALSDYLYSFEKLAEFADYVAINVSSPNTPGLRALQDRDKLEALLAGLQAKNIYKRPIMVKVAPDLGPEELADAVECCVSNKISAIIATNTTLTRDGLSVATSEAGGLSGMPLRLKSLERVAFIYKVAQGRLPIIGVGGIFNAQDAFNMVKAGASLVQIYTSLIYQGPSVVKDIKQGLVKLIESEGGGLVSDYVGRALQRKT